MKKILFVACLIIAFTSLRAQQSNILLSADFWKQKPSADLVKAEIARGANPAELNSRSFDPTTLAINSGAPNETIKFLLAQKGNEVNKITHDSRIYLHWAAMRGNTEIVQYLIANGSSIDVQDSKESEPLVYAVSAGQANTAMFDTFFKAGINVKKKYKNGANLLLLAIANDKDLSISNYLIGKGLSLNEVDEEGNTAFDYAAKGGNIELLKTLLDKGVKPTGGALIFASQSAGRGASAIGINVYKYLVEDVKIITTFTNKMGENVLHGIAVKANQEEIINYFLAKGVDLNKANLNGVTPFMNAVLAGSLPLVKSLLPTVKNINAVNADGESVLTLAVANGSPDLVSFLLANGADVKVVNKAGHNLAYRLVQSYQPNQADAFTEKMNLLVAKGLNVNDSQKDGNTLYHAAIAKADVQLLKKLVDLKININAKNKEGLTALHKAALIAKNDEVLKYLIAIGADKTMKTDFDEIAYDLALENEFLSKNKVTVTFLK